MPDDPRRTVRPRLAIRAALLAGIPLVVMSAIGVGLLMEGRAAEGRGTLVTGVIVAAVAGGSVLYQIAGWSLLWQSLVHFGVMCMTVLPALLASGWFPLENPVDHCIVIGEFLLTGAVLWGVLAGIFGVLVPRLVRRHGLPSGNRSQHARRG